MNADALSALLVIVAILFVMAVSSEILVGDELRDRNLFGYLFVSTLVFGVVTTLLIEKIDARILRVKGPAGQK